MEIWDLLKDALQQEKNISKMINGNESHGSYNPLKKQQTKTIPKQLDGKWLNFRMGKTLPSWWFQPIWKILVKMGIFPK